MSTGIWFVTPAWGRYAITAVCLEQRRRVIAELAANGIEAHQVVIADDENLDTARALGADTVECPNALPDGTKILGRRWNLGMLHAAREGAEWIVQIGSDSWIATDYLLGPMDPGLTRTSPAYCAVTPTRMARLMVAPSRMEHTAGPYVFHRSLLEPSGFASCEESSRFTDTSTIAGIVASGQEIRWQSVTVHPYQYVGFRVPPLMTTYRSLRRRWLVCEMDPWKTLPRYYPPDLVTAARKAMQA